MNNTLLDLTLDEEVAVMHANEFMQALSCYFHWNNHTRKKEALEVIIEKLSSLLKIPIIIRNSYELKETIEDWKCRTHKLDRLLKGMLLWFNALEHAEDIDSEGIHRKLKRLYDVLYENYHLEWWDNLIRNWSAELRRSVKGRIWDVLIRINQTWYSLLQGAGFTHTRHSTEEIINELQERINSSSPHFESLEIWERESIQDIIDRLKGLLKVSREWGIDTKKMAQDFINLKVLVSWILTT